MLHVPTKIPLFSEHHSTDVNENEAPKADPSALVFGLSTKCDSLFYKEVSCTLRSS